MASFGTLLKQYREATKVPETKKLMSQRVLADYLSQKLGWNVQGSTIGYWERDQVHIGKRARLVLIGLISVFVDFKSMKTRDEAEQFLRAGGYSPLEDEEVEQINPDWPPTIRSLFLAGGSRTGRNQTARKKAQSRSQIPEQVVIGRDKELQVFSKLLNGKSEHWLLNIFGPGGIGKTALAGKLKQRSSQLGVPFAFLDGISCTAPDRILYEIKAGISETAQIAPAFGQFDVEYQDYLTIQTLMAQSGGIQQMYDLIGNPKESLIHAHQLSRSGTSASLRQNLANRFVLERYLRGIENSLTDRLSDGLSGALEIKKPLALIVDTYEEMEGLDEWVYHQLVPTLPAGVYLVILGRNELPKISYEWKEMGKGLKTEELAELEKQDAISYLRHYGLTDAASQERIYRFTGGYPLLLVLVRHLAEETGGWEKIGHLERSSDRDSIARDLLNRILREERVEEVRTFLENGVVARWFDPGTISLLLEVSTEEGRKIYDKLHRHSFVERHPYGLKFHDKIRELLLERLRFTSQSKYERLSAKLLDYYAKKAGIEDYAKGASEIRRKSRARKSRANKK